MERLCALSGRKGSDEGPVCLAAGSPAVAPTQQRLGLTLQEWPGSAGGCELDLGSRPR